MRPCPLSIVVATCPAGGAVGRSSRGKSGCSPLCLLLGSEPRTYVSRQRRLVVLDREEVVAAALDDLRANVALAKHRVAGEDLAPSGQDAQQFLGRFVFVGLGIHSDLGQDGLGRRAVGGHEVLSRHFPVTTASRRLAVQGDGLFARALRQTGGRPNGQAVLEG